MSRRDHRLRGALAWLTPLGLFALAVAVRGILFEVDVSTGNVPRMGPLGVELPSLPSPDPAPEPAESESSPDDGS